MTCIVGMEHDGKVYIGGDSMASDGWTRNITLLPKVFRAGEFVIGYTDSFRMGQILQHHLAVRAREEGEEDDHYIVTGFVEAVRQLLKDHGYTRVEANQEEGGFFLLGYRGKLYRIESDFQANRFHGGIATVGAGEQYAKAVMVALEDVEPVQRITRALRVAAELCAMVAPPFYIEVLE